MMIVIISIATFLFTLLGGLFALRLKDKLHLILGFSAGAVIAVAFFDLMPEALELGGSFYDSSEILSLVAAGFLAYLVLDRLIFLHGHAHDHGEDNTGTHHTRRGILGAGSLCVHSFFDGIAIGLAFQVSAPIGAIVAVAVLVHDFSDGVNTVNLILKGQDPGANGQAGRSRAFGWLIADAVAPVLGILSTLFFSVPQQGLSVILAIFSGFFLYIGASDLIPESHHSHPKFLTTVMTLLGAAVLYVAILLAGV